MENIEEIGANSKCTSCQVCGAICPFNAITIVSDKNGFYIPKVNHDLCTHCGLCVKVCAKIHSANTEENNSKVFYAYQTKRKNVLRSSSSGGFSSDLMEILVKEGYQIVGVEYDVENKLARNAIYDSYPNIDRFRGSKYFQSYSIDAFKTMIKNLGNEKYAIFGTPCQLFGIDLALRALKKRDKVVLISVFCHGAASTKVWQKYLEAIPYNQDICHVSFRSKIYGWHRFASTFELVNGNIRKSKKVFDRFYSLYFSGYVLNQSCYDCGFRNSLSFQDFAMADFWGKRFDTNTEGVSLVAVCSPLAESLFDKMKTEVLASSINFFEATKAQSFGKNRAIDLSIRNKVLSSLDRGIEEAYKNYLVAMSKKDRNTYNLRNLSYHIPYSIVGIFKNLVRK